MLPNATDYLFTTGADRNIIRGGQSADAMAISREHWLWMNECVRTLEYQDTFTLEPFRASYAGSTERNNPMAMAPVRSVLDDWKARADAIVTRSRISGIDGTGVIWGSSVATEASSATTVPTVTEAQLNAHVTRMSHPATTMTDGMAPRMGIFSSLFGSTSNTVNYYCLSRSWLPSSIGRSLHPGTVGAPTFGDLQTFFHASPEWQCNGSASDAPEDDSRPVLSPFVYWATRLNTRATTYFREYVQEEHDLVYVADTSLGYNTPSQPWPTETTSLYPVYSFYPIFALCVCPIWKTGDVYEYDAKRSWCVISPVDSYGGSCQGGSRLTVNVGGSIRQLCDNTIAAASRAGFNPATIPGTQPYDPGTRTGWTKVGYQLYAYPTYMLAVATSAARNMGS